MGTLLISKVREEYPDRTVDGRNSGTHSRARARARERARSRALGELGAARDGRICRTLFGHGLCMS